MSRLLTASDASVLGTAIRTGSVGAAASREPWAASPGQAANEQKFIVLTSRR